MSDEKKVHTITSRRGARQLADNSLTVEAETGKERTLHAIGTRHVTFYIAERTHRWKLWRIWNSTASLLIVIGTNPSKADESDNDPTIERVDRRARMLGYGGIIMLNMLNVIETDSRLLKQMPSEQRCTAENTGHLLAGLDMAQNGKADILCAWGKPGQKYGAVAWFTMQAQRRNVTLFCLGKNEDNSPVHPLYQPYSKAFEWFGGAASPSGRRA